MLSIFKMVIDGFPSGVESGLSFVHSINVCFIQFGALNKILAIFKHRLDFWLVLFYFIEEELWQKVISIQVQNNKSDYFQQMDAVKS